MTAKIKLRLRAIREHNGSLVVTPINDELLIAMPTGESYESLRSGFIG